MVEARVRRLPGYVERLELTRQKGPAFRLRQYASRVLGDMQLHDQVGFKIRPLSSSSTVATRRSQICVCLRPCKGVLFNNHITWCNAISLDPYNLGLPHDNFFPHPLTSQSALPPLSPKGNLERTSLCQSHTVMQVSDDEYDDISATRYIASREAPTPVRPIRAGRKWGKRMPSPFDDPASSADLDEGDDEEEQQSLDESPSVVSSELDPSITNPVRITCWQQHCHSDQKGCTIAVVRV